MKRIKIEDIDFELEYEGYLWYSNASKPDKITRLKKEDFKELPFIIEGNLYSKDKDVSISIKWRDGEYFIYAATNLKSIPADQKSEEEYLAHDLDGVEKIRMLRYWEEKKENEMLEGMTSLVPSWQAFIGFIN